MVFKNPFKRKAVTEQNVRQLETRAKLEGREARARTQIQAASRERFKASKLGRFTEGLAKIGDAAGRDLSGNTRRLSTTRQRHTQRQNIVYVKNKPKRRQQRQQFVVVEAASRARRKVRKKATSSGLFGGGSIDNFKL